MAAFFSAIVSHSVSRNRNLSSYQRNAGPSTSLRMTKFIGEFDPDHREGEAKPVKRCVSTRPARSGPVRQDKQLLFG